MKYKLVSDIEKLWLVRIISKILRIDSWLLANLLYEEYNKALYSEICDHLDNDRNELAIELLAKMDSGCTRSVYLNSMLYWNDCK